MPRFYVRHDGCDEGWFQNLTDDACLSMFVARIQERFTPGLTLDETRDRIRVYRYAGGRRNGAISLMEYGDAAAGRFVQARRESEDDELGRTNRR